MTGWMWITLLWPGLGPMWVRGSWSALGIALLFAGALNLALIATFYWPEWLPGSLVWTLWTLVVCGWIVGAIFAMLQADSLVHLPTDAGSDDLYRRAQTAYLRMEWLEAEELLGRLLDRRGEDVEARFLLVSLLRRGGRVDEAKEHLRALQNLEAAEAWSLELEQEQVLLADAPLETPLHAEDEADEDAPQGADGEGGDRFPQAEAA